MRQLLALFTAIAIPALFAAETDAAGDDDAAPPPLAQCMDASFWIYPEFASGLQSMGCIKSIYPVFNLDAGMALQLKEGRFGRIILGIWSQSDVSSHYHNRRRYAFQENDPIVAYAYTWHFREGWNLSSQIGNQWNFMSGYYGNANHSYDEFQIWERLNTPWGTIYAGMRDFYLPVCKAFYRAGITRTFQIAGPLSLIPTIFLDGGSERWNRQRVGYGEHKRKIGEGVSAMVVQTFLDYRLSKWLSLYGGVAQYFAIGDEIRDSLEANPSPESKKDFLIVTIGAKMDF